MLSAITVEGTSLSTAARNVKVLAYGQGVKRGSNFTIPYRDGEWTHQKWYGPSDLLLEIYLKSTPSPEENLSTILGLFNQTYGTATIAGTHPFAGSVQAEVELLRNPSPSGSNPYVYRFQLRNPKGNWEAVTATTSTGNSGTPAAFTTSGDKPVDDFTVLFATTGTLTHTDSQGTVSTVTLAAGASTGVTVDMGNRTVQTSTGGNQDAHLTVDQEYWMRLEPGSTQAFTATMNHTVTWKSKWAV